MMNMKSFIVIVVISMCFYGTSSLFIWKGSSGSGAAAASGSGAAAGQGQLNVSIQFNSAAATKFCAAVQTLYSSFFGLINSFAAHAGLASSSAFKLFIDPLNDFFKLFANVVFISAEQFTSALEDGLDNLRIAISNGWKLVADLGRQGNVVLASVVGTFVASLQGVLMLANTFKVTIHGSAGFGGGASASGAAAGGVTVS